MYLFSIWHNSITAYAFNTEALQEKHSSFEPPLAQAFFPCRRALWRSLPFFRRAGGGTAGLPGYAR